MYIIDEKDNKRLYLRSLMSMSTFLIRKLYCFAENKLYVIVNTAY